jgi:hypothetical protein
MIDALYATREKRLDLDKQSKILKEQEQEMRNIVLELLENAGLKKASGQMATCGIKTNTIPIVTDWDQLFTYIRDNDRFDLIQKRISVLAWRETLDNTGLIPGTEAVEQVDISLTKSSRS